MVKIEITKIKQIIISNQEKSVVLYYYSKASRSSRPFSYFSYVLKEEEPIHFLYCAFGISNHGWFKICSKYLFLLAFADVLSPQIVPFVPRVRVRMCSSNSSIHLPSPITIGMSQYFTPTFLK